MNPYLQGVPFPWRWFIAACIVATFAAWFWGRWNGVLTELEQNLVGFRKLAE